MEFFLDRLANHEERRYKEGVFRRGLQALRWAMEQQGHRRRLRCRYPLSGHARNPRSHEEHPAIGSSYPLHVVPRFI